MVRWSSARGKLCMPEPGEAFKKWLHVRASVRAGQGRRGPGGVKLK